MLITRPATLALASFGLVSFVTLFSTAARATPALPTPPVYVCTGPHVGENLAFALISGGELREQSKGFARGVRLVELSGSLSEGMGGIESDDEQEELLARRTDISPRGTTVSDWSGNWGFTLQLPNAIFLGPVRGNFRVGYDYRYDDIDTFTVRRTLTCSLAPARN